MAYTGSKAYSGRGSALAIGPVQGTSSPTYIHIGEISDSSLSELTLALEDTTNFDSGVFIERTGTVIDPGTVTITYNYIAGGTDPGQQALQAAQISTNPYMFQLTLPLNKLIATPQTTTGDTFTFNAIVTKVGGLKIQPKNKIEGTAELTITGARVFTAGS